MRSIVIVLFLYTFSCFAQISVKGIVRDSKKKTVLPYCGISIKAKTQSCIANEDGEFLLNVKSEKDSIIVSFLGYKAKTVAASSLLNKPVIYLEPKEIVTVQGLLTC